MARVGNNPLKGAAVKGHPPVVATVVTHLPNETGYHARRFEVVRFSLESLRKGAPGTPVLVWDNGSCAHLREWLQDEYRPEYLIFTENMGKYNARSSTWRMFPEQTIIAAADDDMGYRPGWLAAQMEILQKFPNAGPVTGYVARTAFRWGISSTLKWAQEHAQLEVGRFIPDEYEAQFALSVERTPEWQREYTKNDKDYRVTYRGVSAYCTSAHCQFISYQHRLLPFMTWSRLAIPGEREFDEAIDRAGLLRLGTIERFTWHLGNVLEKEVECIDTSETGNTSPVCQPAI